jgi:hypothetical protein|tara:strand:- start:551 stop:814 length:264 start_codon:yes stop_codon:yes gene_type:complete
MDITTISKPTETKKIKLKKLNKPPILLNKLEMFGKVIEMQGLEEDSSRLLSIIEENRPEDVEFYLVKLLTYKGKNSLFYSVQYYKSI